MDNIKLPKQLLYGELQHSRLLKHEPKKGFKGVVKSVTVVWIDIWDWEQMKGEAEKKVVYESI